MYQIKGHWDGEIKIIDSDSKEVMTWDRKKLSKCKIDMLEHDETSSLFVWKEIRNLLSCNKTSDANAKKHELEESQRARRKQPNFEYKPKFFEQKNDQWIVRSVDQ
jgi:hypothetical protein